MLWNTFPALDSGAQFSHGWKAPTVMLDGFEQMRPAWTIALPLGYSKKSIRELLFQLSQEGRRPPKVVVPKINVVSGAVRLGRVLHQPCCLEPARIPLKAQKRRVL